MAAGDDIVSELRSYGAPPSTVRPLNTLDWRALQYLDLFPGLSGAEALDLRPDAVVETGGSPLLYVVRRPMSSPPQDVATKQLLSLKRTLAFRGDNAFLAVLSPGELDLYPIDRARDLPTPHRVKKASPEAESFVLDLSQGAIKLDAVDSDRAADRATVHELMFDVLTNATQSLLTAPGLQGDSSRVVSLVGRALFTRFLIDRNVLNARTFPWLEQHTNGQFSRCFDTPELAAQTCSWLDATFNGNLLPLQVDDYSAFFAQFNGQSHPLFHELGKIAARTSSSGQMLLDWGDINFAHVPVGLLSQVYEHYSHRLFNRAAREESVHYTPSAVAQYVMDEAFAALKTCEPAEALVLDPAAGAGVFLTLALRRLVSEEWKRTGKRPTTQRIRDILRNQVHGLDINESALRLAALSLYLTALELDPNPGPPEHLVFPELLGTNLLAVNKDVRANSADERLGSLRMNVARSWDQRFDVVVGNPPWTSWSGQVGREANEVVNTTVRSIARARAPADSLPDAVRFYQNPDNVPDLPFVWRSLVWSKPNGTLAFVLHGRLLFKQQTFPTAAREALFSMLKVEGLLNGTDVARLVWPGMNQPFCVLLATNALPRSDDSFYYVSPSPSDGPTGATHIVIDYQNATPVHPGVLRDNPTLLKVLYTGTPLDADLIGRLEQRVTRDSDGGWRRLEDYWKRDLGLDVAQGYQVGNEQREARFLMDLNAHMLEPSIAAGYHVETKQLPLFNRQMLQWPRRAEIYRTPLALVSESPGDGQQSIRCRWAGADGLLAYNRSYYGFSGHGHSDGEALTKYVFALSNSSLFVYYLLMTSSRVGVERRALLLDEIVRFPVRPWGTLSEAERVAVLSVSERMIRTDHIDIDALNRVIFDLYGFDAFDAHIVSDALETRMPYDGSRKRAMAPPSDADCAAFISALNNGLSDFMKLRGHSVTVEPIALGSRTWRFLRVFTRGSEANGRDSDVALSLVETLANNEGATRAFLHDGAGNLVLALRNQYQYWTLTRAAQCTMDLLPRLGGGLGKVANG